MIFCTCFQCQFQAGFRIRKIIKICILVLLPSFNIILSIISEALSINSLHCEFLYLLRWIRIQKIWIHLLKCAGSETLVPGFPPCVVTPLQKLTQKRLLGNFREIKFKLRFGLVKKLFNQISWRYNLII